jgi:hypothetical protein
MARFVTTGDIVLKLCTNVPRSADLAEQIMFQSDSWLRHQTRKHKKVLLITS